MMTKSWRRSSSIAMRSVSSTCHHQRRRAFKRVRLVRSCPLKDLKFFISCSVLKDSYLLCGRRAGQAGTGDRATKPAFKEEDRLSFLEICGVRQLSDCVKSQSQTESWRPCPPMQSLVRSVIPYIQRFLYHREELAEVYSELKDRNIAEKLKSLSFGQVGKSF